MNRLLIALTLLSLLFLCACASVPTAPPGSIASADVLYTEQGDEILGKVIKVDGKNIHFVKIDGEILKVPLAKVQRLQFAQSASKAKGLDDLNDQELAIWIRTAPGPEDLPGYSKVVLYSVVETKVLDSGMIQVRNREVTKILNEKGKSVGNRKVTFFPDNQTLEVIKARSIAPDGTIFELPHTAIKEARPYGRLPLYDRRVSLVFAVPNSEIGSVIDVETVKTYMADDLSLPIWGHSYFASTIPILRDETVLDFPEGSKMIYAKIDMNKGPALARLIQGSQKILGAYSTGEVKETVSRSNGRVRTTWYAENLPVFGKEPYSTSYDEITPKLSFGAKATWREISEYFHGNIEKLSKLDGAAKEYVHKITDGKPPLEAAVDLYNDLVFKIHLVNVSPNSYSYMPHNANEIFGERYANDWDKTFLYWAMLIEAGINGELIAVRPWDWYVRAGEIPSIRMFRYLVIKLELDGKTHYVSCAKENVPFGQLESWLWKGEGLVLSTSEGRLEKLPPILPEENKSTKVMEIKVDRDGNGKITLLNSWTGPVAFQHRWSWRYSDEEVEMNFVRMARGINPNAKLVSFEFSDQKNLNKAVWEKVLFDATPLQVISANRFMALDLPFTNYGPASAQEGERRFDLWMGAPYTHFYTYKIIPEKGVKIVGVPDAVELKSPLGRFSRKVKRNSDGSITMTDVVEYFGYKYSADNYLKYVEYMSLRQKAGRQKVIFDLK